MLAGPALIAPEIASGRYQAAAVVWIGLLMAARWSYRGRITRKTPLDPPVVALALMLPGAAAASIDPYAALSRITSLVFAVALFYALANAITTPERMWRAVSFLMLGGMALAAMGLVTADWLDKFPLLATLASAIPGSTVAMPHPTLAAGVHPNQLGGLLVLFVPLALACLAWPGQRKTGRRRSATPEANPTHLAPPGHVRAMAIAALAVTVPTLALTQSRGAWMGLAVGLGCMALLFVAPRLDPSRSSRHPSAPPDHTRSRRMAALVATVWLTALLLAVPAATAVANHLPRSEELAGASGTGRFTLWPKVLAMVDAAPLTGIGLNSFPLVFDQRPEYEGHFVYAGIPHAHNTLLQAGADYGLAGMTAVVGIYSALAWTGARAIRRLGTTPAAPAVIGLAFGLVAHVTHGVVDAVAIGSKTGFVPWAFAGVLVAARLNARMWLTVPAGGPRSTTDQPASDSDAEVDPSVPPAPPNGRVVSTDGDRTRTFAAALGAWLVTSVAAVAVGSTGAPLGGLLVATVGGAVFGVLSATRVDSRRQRGARRTPKKRSYLHR